VHPQQHYEVLPPQGFVSTLKGDHEVSESDPLAKLALEAKTIAGLNLFNRIHDL
jgi:hypothetical protein